MKPKNYRSLIYFIAATIAVTIAIQLYWNIQNYKQNRQRLINEVQISLDNGVEAYYANLAKNDFFAFVERSGAHKDHKVDTKKVWVKENMDSIITALASDSLHYPKGITGFTQLLDSGTGINVTRSGAVSSVSVFSGKHAIDSIRNLQGLANKIVVSIIRDSLNFEKLDTLFNQELKRKEIAISYALKHFKNDSVIGSFNPKSHPHLKLTTYSKSTYLPETEKLQLFFTNPTLAILKRSVLGIGLSFLLSACIITCLLYLLRIIQKQKELAEIKNDLISNITHEFKTPIATVFTAIEGIKSFNDANDTEKTNSYLDLSQQQLKKLTTMVEKLLETATLDSDKLLLNRERTDLVFMLQKLAEKHQILAKDKNISFKTSFDECFYNVDPFHFENAIANLIDNAVKYGGDTIEIHMSSLLNSVEISVADNGGKIDKHQRDKIFDKFYRIPTGNRHDVKGFGIGLFYTKKIIEKHGGQVTLLPNAENTIFKITL